MHVHVLMYVPATHDLQLRQTVGSQQLGNNQQKDLHWQASLRCTGDPPRASCVVNNN